MKVTFIPVDSEVFGRSVLSIDDFSPFEDFAPFEAAYLERHAPWYVVCKVPLERVADVHALERNGFELVECQIRSTVGLGIPRDTSRFPYEFRLVSREEDLEAVLEIAGTTFRHDRFSVDPRCPHGLSGERYRRYVRRSFAAEDEAVYRLCDPRTNATLAFKTHRNLGRGEALLLLGGVHTDYVMSGLGVANTFFELEALRAKGFHRATTHISASNLQVFNLEIGRLGFRVVATFAVLRKTYGAPVG